MFRPRLLLISSLLFLTSTPFLYSQDARGALVGTVSDTTGAVIAGVQVDVTNKAMGTKVSLRTNEAGFYIANFLIPGSYTVSAEHPGFKKFIRDGVEVRVNDRIEVEVKLEVGSAEQSVTVSAETPLLNTESASLGTVVDGRRVAELPIPHGNPYFLIGLAAGVVTGAHPLIGLVANPQSGRP